jgi:hypothetical protein
MTIPIGWPGYWCDWRALNPIEAHEQWVHLREHIYKRPGRQWLRPRLSLATEPVERRSKPDQYPDMA